MTMGCLSKLEVLECTSREVVEALDVSWTNRQNPCSLPLLSPWAGVAVNFTAL